MGQFANPASAAAANAERYVASLMEILGDRDPLGVLRETTGRLEEMLDRVAPDVARRPEAPGKWSLAEVVQHLADSELVGGLRFRMALAQPGAPIPGYDQDAWARELDYAATDLADALRQFAVLREANLRLLARSTPAERERVVLHGERGEESVEKMIRMYAGHDLVHLRQLGRILGRVGG